ncbi:hypothetical protein [Sphingopyxis sp. 22461]|jgi:hypothetical protein|uniref:hypothetical protein n=1 Tax=Sphingopyxis sp. 22461 TaxID=3453923 RepID=UPI003F8382C1
MNGLFSATPSPRVIRLVVAGLLFGCIQSAILLAAPEGTTAPRSLLLILGLLAFGSLIGAIIGESRGDPHDRWRKRRA